MHIVKSFARTLESVTGLLVRVSLVGLATIPFLSMAQTSSSADGCDAFNFVQIAPDKVQGVLGGGAHDVSFVNFKTGVVCGYGGAYRTDDGGINWRKLPLEDLPDASGMRVDGSGRKLRTDWNAIRMISSEEIWVFGQIHPGGPDVTRLLCSKDGGQTWTTSLAGQLDSVLALRTGPPGELWALGRQTAFVTRDYGKNWTPVKMEEPTAHIPLQLRDVCMVNDRLYFGLAEGVQPRGVFYMFRSDDAGEHWTSLSGAPPESMLRFCQFISPSIGWVAGQELFHTEDGGATWTKVSLPLNPEQRITSLAMFQDGRGWISANLRLVGMVVRDLHSLLFTSDGGVTWQPASGGRKVTVSSMCWLDPDHGWAGGGIVSVTPSAVVGLFDRRILREP